MVKKNLHPIVVSLLAMWLTWIADSLVPADLTQLGLFPRSIRGLAGIPLMPFLHASFGHLLSNTIPLAILLSLAVASRPRAWSKVIAITLGSGLLLWVFGRSAIHVGASGLVFGLITYLVVVGYREKHPRSIVVSLFVAFLFGGTMLSGIVPGTSDAVSWDGHLCGAIAGFVVGSVTTKRNDWFA